MRTAASCALVGALALSGIGIALPAQAAVSVDADILINEVYGGGGNNGATLTHDFVELVNVGDAAVDISGWTLQYASTGGAFNTNGNQPHVLSGTIAPGASFLVQEAKGSGGTTALPTPDASGPLGLSGTGGKVALATDSTTVVGPDTEQVVDYVAWGTNAAPAAGGSPAPATTNSTSVSRNGEHANTANNLADFAVGAPSPQNSGTTTPDPEPTATNTPTPTASPTASPSPSPSSPQTLGIADIQGTGAASGRVGQTVTTEGVVTAHYPSGGLNGYVLQTSGSGGEEVENRTASDAIFVYARNATVTNEVALGETVRVTGQVGEFRGQTQITVAAGAAEVIAAQTTPEPLAISWPETEAEREAIEHMLIQPLDSFTVTDTHDTNSFGEVGLATGTTQLRQPTDAAQPGSAEAAAIAADNFARGVILDDGASTNFADGKDGELLNGNLVPPYVSLTEPVVNGGTATIDEPVVVGYGFDKWRLIPSTQVVGDGTGEDDGVTFTHTRPAAPSPVGGDLSVASFNVLNYFTTLGEGVTGCDAYEDRTGDGNNVRIGCDLRGAWDAEDLARQQSKIVAAINELDASVVGLMEIENSAALGEPVDEATASLVAALNATEPGKWDFVPSSEELPSPSTRDVITNAIIYQPALVERVGESRALGTLSDDHEAFNNAREPIAQVFAPVGGGEELLFSVNHLKSKGSAGPLPGDGEDPNGQGRSNASRVAQATALADWVDSIKGDVESVALAGDFNSYGYEDPIDVLRDAGYESAEISLGLDESSYSFDGMAGSLDHVLLNDAAELRVTGGDIWNINSPESVALEYSRYNNHGVLFWEEGPYRSSDHDPIKVGLAKGEFAPTEIDILTINDFHGRLEETTDPRGLEAGAAVVAGAVDAHRAANPNTLFVSAGDNIGGSTFTSFSQEDNPTIDALVAAGLDVSAVGNHEFDRGFADLRDRVIPRFGGNDGSSAPTPEQIAVGREFALGANVYSRTTGLPVLPEYAIKEVDGVDIAFIGTVTPDTATMVDPAGISTIRFGDQLEAANRVADELIAMDDAPDVIVLLTHSGAAASSCEAVLDEQGFGALATGASAHIDAIVSAHTHQTYACEVPIAEAPGQTRPVIQASEYGKSMGKLELTIDTTTHEIITIDGSTFPLRDKYEPNAEVAAIVAEAVAAADVIGRQEVGEISGDILRGGTPPGNDRGVESSMGNWVADVYLWATQQESYVGAPGEIAIMNPGGLRADLLHAGDGIVTYKEAAEVQPFANTLVTVTLNGEQLRRILEDQWKATGDRPKLHLGISEGFTYEYVQDADPRSGTIGDMFYQGELITPGDEFTVVTNSFLANGGDGFPAFAEGTDRTDTGQVDLEATVDYFAAAGVVDPAPLGRAILDDGTDPTDPGTDPELPGTGTPPAPVNPGGTPPAAGVQVGGTWAKVVLSNGGRVEQGETLKVTVTGLEPGQQIAATLFSDPIVVTGIPAANAAGATTFSVAIPSDFAVGAHRLVITSAGLDPISVGVTVVRQGALAVTGADVPWALAVGGGFLLIAGGAAFVIRRRRENLV